MISDRQKGLTERLHEESGVSSRLSGVHQLVERQAALSPDAVAVLSDNFEITFAEVNARANQLANYIRAATATPPKVIAVSLTRSPELIATVLAILKSGAAYVPIDPTYPAERRRLMLESSGAAILITNNATAIAFSEISAKVIALDTEWIKIDRESELNLNTVSLASEPCYIIFTSGSTGAPKGVVMPHGPLLNLMEWHRFSPDAPGEFVGSIKLPTRTLQFAPITFDVSFQEIFSTWADGGTLVLVSDSQRIDLAALLAHIARHEVERLFLPVVALQQLAEAVSDGAPAPKSCKDIITAGEALRITPAIQRLFALLPECILHNHYGPSETHVVTSYKLQGTPQTWPNYPPIGKPIWNVSANLADVDGSPVKPGSDGELYLGGACLADGYIGRPDLTVERFLTIGGKTDRVYKTGDHVREDENGDLVFVGRVDQQLKIRGYRVEPGEIEERLRKHEQVANAAVVGKSYGEGDTTLIAYYVAGPGSNPSPAELRSFLRQALPDYMIPSSFTRVDQMPLTSSGKLDRKALEDRTPTRQKEAPARNAVRAGSQLDEDIARLWKEALHTTEIGYDDNFFEVGGTSVQIIRLHRQLKQDLNCDFPITILFEHPTINALTIYLRSSVSGADSNNTDVGQSEGATVINRLRQFRKL